VPLTRGPSAIAEPLVYIWWDHGFALSYWITVRRTLWRLHEKSSSEFPRQPSWGQRLRNWLQNADGYARELKNIRFAVSAELKVTWS